jgi:hypothetical protein
MWAIYALPNSRLTLDARGEQMGGYLSDFLPRSASATPAANRPRAYLVSREWADSLDADATRLSVGRQHAMITQTNKVVAQTGVMPLTGVPQSAKAQFSLTLLPYDDGWLEMEIALRSADPSARLPLTVRYGNPEQAETWQTVRSEYPWSLRLPVHGGVKCQIKVVAENSSHEEYPLQFSRLRLSRSHVP